MSLQKTRNPSVWHHLHKFIVVIGMPQKTCYPRGYVGLLLVDSCKRDWILQVSVSLSRFTSWVYYTIYSRPIFWLSLRGFLVRCSPVLTQWVTTCLFSRWLPENASSDQIAGADPDYPDSADPGRGAWDDSERVRCYTFILQRGRQHIPLQKCGKVALYAHVGLPSTLWAGMFENCNINIVFPACFGQFYDVVPCFSAGVPEADCIPKVHWQKNRLLGGYAAAGREAGRPPTNDKLHQEVSVGHIISRFFFFFKFSLTLFLFSHWSKHIFGIDKS